MIQWLKQKLFAVDSVPKRLESANSGYSDYPRRGAREVLERPSPWQAAAVGRLADAVANTPWMLFRRRNILDGMSRADMQKAIVPTKGIPRNTKQFSTWLEDNDLERIKDHPVLTLLEKPNPINTGWEFWWTIMQHLGGPGETFLVKERNVGGTPVELWIVPPHEMKRTPTKKNPYFEVWKRGEAVPRRIPPEDVIWLRVPDPSNPTHGRGKGTGMVLTQEADLDEEATGYMVNHFKRGAIPGLLIGVENASEDDLKNAKQRWLRDNQGSRNSSTVYFYSGDINVEKLDSSFKDLGIVQLRQHIRDTTIQLYGIPPEILGIIENSNRSTIDAADYLFARWGVFPRLMMIWWTLQMLLLPEFPNGDNLLLGFVNPIPEDKQFQLEVARSAPQTRTVNEWRDLQGLPPLEEGGDELYEPTTYSSANSDESGAENGGQDQDGQEDPEKMFERIARESLRTMQ